MQDLMGILPLDKPAGMTSRQAVDVVKHKLPHRTKVGHAGTLDPFATGLLLVLVGRATKACEALMDAGKSYAATVRLGACTPSDDPETPLTCCVDAPVPDEAAVRQALGLFRGTVSQQPPVYSALKVSGRRAVDRIRAGQKVSLAPRQVRIDRLDLTGYAWPDLHLHLDCGRGFYVRALARDIGHALGTGGHLTALRRTRIGVYSVEAAVQPADLTIDTLPALLKPV